MTIFGILGISLLIVFSFSIAFVVCGCSALLHTWPQGYPGREGGPRCKGHAEYVGAEYTIRALRTAVFLLSPSAVLPVPASLTPYSRVSTSSYQ